MRSGAPLVRAPKFKPRRDRRVSPLVVPCPTCLAEVEVPCVGAEGKTTRHVARRRMAVRAENLAREIS